MGSSLDRRTPPEAGSALGHGLPQPCPLQDKLSEPRKGNISAGRAALPGDCAGSWPPHPGGGKRRKRRKVALESPREQLQEGSCGKLGATLPRSSGVTAASLLVLPLLCF